MSFLGTKLIGLESTSKFFTMLGEVRRRNPFYRMRTVEDISKRLQEGLHRLPIPVECLDQAMVYWHELNLNGYPATLKIGLKLSPMMGHAWVESEGRIFVPVPGIEDDGVVGECPPWRG
jgi:hypothetical protein